MSEKNLVSTIKTILPLLEGKLLNIMVEFKMGTQLIQIRPFIYRLKTADEDIKDKIREDIEIYAVKLLSTLTVKDKKEIPSIFKDMVGESNIIA
jgi:hypothetical protein